MITVYNFLNINLQFKCNHTSKNTLKMIYRMIIIFKKLAINNHQFIIVFLIYFRFVNQEIILFTKNLNLNANI